MIAQPVVEVVEIEAAKLFNSAASSASSRPKTVIIMRGFPGSGKSYVAKILSAMEEKATGSGARVVSLDDYFMEEEESEEDDGEGGVRVATRVKFVFDPSSYAAYEQSAFKAFERLLHSRLDRFIIVDHVHARTRDYERYWRAAKEAGSEVYVCETRTSLDEQSLARRSVHGYTALQIVNIKRMWEPTPPHFVRLTVDVRTASLALTFAR